MIIKHSDLINTLIVCVGGFGFIAGLLRYVDDWREKRKEKPIEFSTFEVLWEAFSGGATANVLLGLRACKNSCIKELNAGIFGLFHSL